MIVSLAPAFSEPVFESQSAFRAVMKAMSRPGLVHDLRHDLSPPAPLSGGAAATILTLLDYETPVWLDAALADANDVSLWLRFHTGAPITHDPQQAAFALIADAANAPDFMGFALGAPDYPDRSTTLILQVESLSSGPSIALKGPGIDGVQMLSARPLPEDFVHRMTDNRALFPRGVDVLLLTDNAVAAVPRSTRIEGSA
ncbi:phosphonate C-P lyase system protein PhnH [Pseudorhodoplanes sinuspersici]|uniref:Phosphonate C-P lyase system protein PhnH n=1 Tax=Pseudorhodoplanes sinuspersici TaxID=1235591 RepID=A0A1W6ZYM1_9HYPH|nr:phosphonate C-P lyase system protein PhnH [Pseudorhodoplanes sinuspersici]ARQ02507.1 phosphonate C-P lyase system protein PhnH [Pseudorhodoplanes sinuspersici]RKE74347.1 alpha-D-ribose 1-methylphosphonate 5-triphosphate synthase subunit PhnH [Pseudorhodoplanes sinuspersici]